MSSPHQNIVVQSEALSQDAADWIGARCELIVRRFDDPLFAESLVDARGLVVRTETRVTTALLERAPRLVVVGRAGVGLDNIDVRACRGRGVEVVYTPHASTQAVVEYVLWLIGDAIRPRPQIMEPIEPDRWREVRGVAVGARQLNEMTLGILGLGRIGSSLAATARCLGVRVIYNDLLEIADDARHGGEPVDAATLFEEADVLSVHVDGRPGNHGLVDETLIARMKPCVTFVNTSRGFVVDKESLARFLRGNPGANAMLDVHDPEPVEPGDPLLELPNARLHPHLASRTRTATASMSWVVRDVVAVLDGQAPQWPAPPIAV